MLRPNTTAAWYEPIQLKPEAAADLGIIGRLVLIQLCVGLGAGVLMPFVNVFYKIRFHVSDPLLGALFPLELRLGEALAGLIGALLELELGGIERHADGKRSAGRCRRGLCVRDRALSA